MLARMGVEAMGTSSSAGRRKDKVFGVGHGSTSEEDSLHPWRKLEWWDWGVGAGA